MFGKIRQLVDIHLASNWYKTEIAEDNTPDLNEIGKSYIAPSLDWTDARAIAIGGAGKSSGYIKIEIYTPAKVGAGEALDLVDEIANLFNNYNKEGLICKRARPQRVGQKKEWYVWNVLIPFTYSICYTN